MVYQTGPCSLTKRTWLVTTVFAWGGCWKKVKPLIQSEAALCSMQSAISLHVFCILLYCFCCFEMAGKSQRCSLPAEMTGEYSLQPPTVTTFVLSSFLGKFPIKLHNPLVGDFILPQVSPKNSLFVGEGHAQGWRLFCSATIGSN